MPPLIAVVTNSSVLCCFAQEWILMVSLVAGKLRASLEGLSAENRRLRLFDADPFDYHSIVDAVRGCSGLFYAFDPPQEEPYDVSFYPTSGFFYLR